MSGMPECAGIISLVTILALSQLSVHAGRATDALADFYANHQWSSCVMGVARLSSGRRAEIACD